MRVRREKTQVLIVNDANANKQKTNKQIRRMAARRFACYPELGQSMFNIKDGQLWDRKTEGGEKKRVFPFVMVKTPHKAPESCFCPETCARHQTIPDTCFSTWHKPPPPSTSLKERGSLRRLESVCPTDQRVVGDKF